MLETSFNEIKSVNENKEISQNMFYIAQIKQITRYE